MCACGNKRGESKCEKEGGREVGSEGGMDGGPGASCKNAEDVSSQRKDRI